MNHSLYLKLSRLSLTILMAGWLSACGEPPLSSDNSTPSIPPVSLKPTSVPATDITNMTAVPTALAQTSPAVANQPTTALPMSTTPSVARTAPQILGIKLNDRVVGLYNKLELSVELDSGYPGGFNPFDPAQLDLQAQFVAPTGKIYPVTGFYWQNYTAQLEGGQENLSLAGKPEWKVRFSPTEIGQWSYTLKVVTPSGQAASTPAGFEVANSSNPGPLRVSTRDPAYLEFSGGQPYFAIGQNVAWYGPGGTADYGRWFKKMADNGANFARVWMPDWAMGLEWKNTPLGDYTNRLDRAWKLDRVFELAERQNIYIMLSLLNHGAFNIKTDPEWKDNPYNQAQGGMLAQPEDFATNPQARELFKRRLRYIVSRWGYSAHLLSWEWWNEVDWTPLGNPALLKPWIAEMTIALKSWDPYPHLVTTSYAKGFDETVYKMPEIDLVQRHQYATNDPALTFPSAMNDLRAFGKPALYGEFGGMGADTSSLDKYGVHLRNGAWAAMMTKSFGTTMPWYWDNYIEPLDLYEQVFKGPASFLKDENLAAGHYQPVQLPTSSGAFKALALKGDRKILGWVKNNAFSYVELKSLYEDFFSKALKNGQKDAQFSPVFPPVEGASLSLTDLVPGNYRLEWWDTTGKGLLRTDNITVTGTPYRLMIPTFTCDLAFKLSA